MEQNTSSPIAVKSEVYRSKVLSKMSSQVVVGPKNFSEPCKDRNDHLRFHRVDTNKTVVIGLDEFKFIIFGRSNSGCHYTLTHPTISRKHALFGHDESGNIQIMDLGSSHGTFIDQQKLLPNVQNILRGGEKVRFGLDTSYFTVVKNVHYKNQKTAENFLEKKKSLNIDILNLLCKPTKNLIRKSINCDMDTSIEEQNHQCKEVKSFKKDLISFFTSLNQSDALDDITTRNTIKQITPSSSPIKKRSLSQEQQLPPSHNNSKSSPSKRKFDSISEHKSVIIKEAIQEFSFLYNDQIGNFKVETKDINYIYYDQPTVEIVYKDDDDDQSRDEDQSDNDPPVRFQKKLFLSSPDNVNNMYMNNGNNNMNITSIINYVNNDIFVKQPQQYMMDSSSQDDSIDFPSSGSSMELVNSLTSTIELVNNSQIIDL